MEMIDNIMGHGSFGAAGEQVRDGEKNCKHLAANFGACRRQCNMYWRALGMLLR